MGRKPPSVCWRVSQTAGLAETVVVQQTQQAGVRVPHVYAGSNYYCVGSKMCTYYTDKNAFLSFATAVIRRETYRQVQSGTVLADKSAGQARETHGSARETRRFDSRDMVIRAVQRPYLTGLDP